MRMTCPVCGERGSEEFACGGDASRVRPEPGASAEAWVEYVYMRANPAGPHSEVWYHHGCRTWLTVTRDTRTNTVLV
jgi:sarcosine oxidase subunit delta